MNSKISLIQDSVSLQHLYDPSNSKLFFSPNGGSIFHKYSRYSYWKLSNTYSSSIYIDDRNIKSLLPKCFPINWGWEAILYLLHRIVASTEKK